MAVQNRIDANQVADDLTTWLAAKLPEATDVVITDVHVPASSGMSYLSILCKARWRAGGLVQSRDLVVRLTPPSGGIFPRYDLGTEAKVMMALAHHTDVPVPDVLWFEEDSSVLGAPFLVMEEVAGKVPADDPPYTHTGWVLDLGEEGQARLYDNALCALARIAAADVETLGLTELGPGPDVIDKHSAGVEQQIAYYEQLFQRSFDGRDHPTIQRAFESVSDTRPRDQQRRAVSWGDSRIGNMIFANDLSVAAVLDWEFAALASPEQDLGWWMFSLRVFSDGVGAPQPPGFPSRTETIERFEELSGHEVVNLDFYELFAALRVAVVVGRIGRMMIEGGMLPEDSPMPISNPASAVLANLLGLPSPAETVADWVGKR